MPYVATCCLVLWYRGWNGNMLITFRVSRKRRETYSGHAPLSVCLSVSVCLSARGRMPTLLRGPGCNLEQAGDAP